MNAFRNRMLAESAELKHRVAGLEAELKSKDGIIFNLKLTQSQGIIFMHFSM